jgi:hypothetical protein
MLCEETADRAEEAFRILVSRVDVAAAHLDECLLRARRLIEPAPFRYRDDRVLGAVDEQNWRTDPVHLFNGVERIPHEQPDGEERIPLAANVDQRCRRPLEHDRRLFHL